MKKVFPYVVVLLLLSGILYFLSNKDDDRISDSSYTKFAIDDTSSVDRIFIADNKGNTSDLVRTDTGWVVNGRYDAKSDGINVLLKTFKLIYIKSPVPKSAQENVNRVMGSTSKRVEIFAGDDEPVRVWHVGHATPDQFGTYMVMETEDGIGPEPYIMNMHGFTGHLYSRFFADDRDWRTSEIFHYKARDIRKVKMNYPGFPEFGFVLRSDGVNSFELEALSGLRINSFDTVAAKDLLINLQRVNFEIYAKGVTPEMGDSIRSTEPIYTIEIEDMNGVRKSVEVYYKLPEAGELANSGDPIEYDIDRYLALLSSGDFVVVQSFAFDRIGIDLGYFGPEIDSTSSP